MAQDADAEWANLVWQRDTLSNGTVAMQAKGVLFGAPQTISVVCYSARKFETHLLQPQHLTATSEQAEAVGAVAAVNGGFFNVKKFIPATLVQIDGQAVMGSTEARELFRVNGIVAFRGRKLVVEECDTTDYPRLMRRYRNILASGPVLIDNGRKFSYADEVYRSNSYYGRHPRAFIGATRKGVIYMIVVDGRFKNEAVGMDIDELVFVADKLNLYEAMNLDGGGSSTLWTLEKGIINYPYDNKRYDHGGERAVSNVVVAVPR